MIEDLSLKTCTSKHTQSVSVITVALLNYLVYVWIVVFSALLRQHRHRDTPWEQKQPFKCPVYSCKAGVQSRLGFYSALDRTIIES